MKNKIKELITGIILITFGCITLLIERLTNAGISGFLGKLYCGENYLRASGQAGDGMCGFNADTIVGLVCFLFILTGLIMTLIGVIKMLIRKKKS